MKEQNILQVIKKKYNAILQEKLVGIYVHGSIAFGCFNWDKSDIDFLVVVNKQLTQNEKEVLISELLSLDEECPAKGLEMSVVLADVCKPFVYPTPFELHFSNFHKERAKADLAEYCKNMNGVDKDLAAHMMVIHAVGITLCGQVIEDVFAPVPKTDYIDSIYNDIACAEEDILEDSVYAILNLCRVLAYLRDDRVLSKSQGGEWGLRYLSPKYHPTIRNAMETYEGLGDFTEKAMLQEFAKDMLENIRGYMNEELEG